MTEESDTTEPSVAEPATRLWKIYSWWNREKVIAEIEAGSFKAAIEALVKRGSDLRGSNLRGSDLRGSDLRGSDLRDTRDDLHAVLSAVPAEVAALRAAIAEGRIDGSAYEGECACLVCTIANARHAKYDLLPELSPDSDRPAERWFLAIRKGDTPKTSQVSEITLGWIDEWIAEQAALAPVEATS